jgi:hypothetical protein
MTTRQKPYYSVRTGKNPLAERFDLDTTRELFKTVFVYLEDEGYFQEALGYHCVDAGFLPGSLGHDLDGALLLELRKRDLTPIRTRIADYSEEDLFDMIEFLYEHCSKPTQRRFHDYSACGWHCSEFDKMAGRAEYRERINKVLALYDKGYELSSDGEILELITGGVKRLVEAKLPGADPENVTARVAAAERKFLRHRSTTDERRDAIRDLADVLEFLRPKLKAVLAKEDENELFNLLNNFGIRHHRAGQKTNYDKPIFYSWMFHHYLAAIHAAVRLIERGRK